MSAFKCGGIVLVLLLASACGRDSTTTSPTTPTVTIPVATATFSLTGTVTDSATANGIPAATVTIVDGVNAGKSTFTSSSGGYSFSGLLQSGFTVNVTASGYGSLSKGVSLTSNQTLSFPLIKVVSTFTVNGAVTDETSRGILPGIRVSITTGTNAGRSTTTDSAGNYSFSGITAGSMTISGSATSYVTVDKIVTVTTNTRVDFVLPRVAAVVPVTPVSCTLGTGGFVTVSTDVTTKICWVSPISLTINGCGVGSISNTGSATFAVAPGSYNLQACDKAGCASRSVSVSPGGTFSSVLTCH